MYTARSSEKLSIIYQRLLRLFPEDMNRQH